MERSEEGAMEALNRLRSYVALVEKSGSASPDLVSRCSAAVTRWKRLPPVRAANVTFDAPPARALGCVVAVQNLSHQNYREVTEAILADDAVTTWSGSVFASGPIQADGGQVAITWILFEHT